jgi:hypothetical protein
MSTSSLHISGNNININSQFIFQILNRIIQIYSEHCY